VLTKFLSLLAVSVLAMGAIACSDDDDDEAGGAESQLCADLNELSTAIRQVEALGPTSTVDQAKQARDGLKNALDDVRESARNVGSARVDNLEDAFSNLEDEVDELEGSTTLAAASGQIRTQVASVAAARQSLSQQISCPS
jgi:hypothetical protein